jgi:hypothetical protein
LLKTADDAETLNDAAYELADANLDLPLDESCERKALQKLTTETETWTLDESPATLRAKTNLLLASWDTMGWILYREGKLEQAIPYLEAARLGRPAPEIVKHLADARQALAASSRKTIVDPDANKSDQQLRTISLGRSGDRRGFTEYRLLLSQGRVARAEATGDEKLQGGEELLKAADLQRFFPVGSDAKLVRQGVVNCVDGQCDLVLEP